MITYSLLFPISVYALDVFNIVHVLCYLFYRAQVVHFIDLHANNKKLFIIILNYFFLTNTVIVIQ